MKPEPRFVVSRSRVVVSLLAVLAGLLLSPSGIAWAQPAQPFTEISTFSDDFSGDFTCRDEPYHLTANGFFVVHLTYFPDSDTFHVLVYDHGTVVAVPVDGTGPTYTGTFSDVDSNNVRVVKRGDVLVDKDTDVSVAVAHGSDGSVAFVMSHSQLTVNANGETAVQFQVDRMLCT